ncbi:unnamed protein product [Durusdinium trenchii]|uniref:Uncharacterized protein n=1 Tax=Durusdinium trenchii TaxID=1381693 RepID=A0ABP0P6W4_9DINO
MESDVPEPADAPSVEMIPMPFRSNVGSRVDLGRSEAPDPPSAAPKDVKIQVDGEARSARDSQALRMDSSHWIRPSDGATALHRAAERANSSVVTRLLAARAAVNAVDHEGATALHRAAAVSTDNGDNGDVVKVVKQLLMTHHDLNLNSCKARVTGDRKKNHLHQICRAKMKMIYHKHQQHHQHHRRRRLCYSPSLPRTYDLNLNRKERVTGDRIYHKHQQHLRHHRRRRRLR